MLEAGFKARWVAALRSGTYVQGQGRLRRSRNEFCCLGVACDLMDPESWEGDLYCNRQGARSLSFIPGGVAFVIGISNAQQAALSRANDAGASFDVIADFIEREAWDELAARYPGLPVE